jgi:hypothetical protein
MVDESTAMDGLPIMKRLVQGIEDEASMGGPACPPTDDAACKGIDDIRSICRSALSNSPQ